VYATAGLSVARDTRRGLLDVVGAIEMCVVDAGEIDVSTAAFNPFAFIEQHADAHLF
jgi:hypothetical protein